jgi:hypothetical protein
VTLSIAGVFGNFRPQQIDNLDLQKAKIRMSKQFSNFVFFFSEAITWYLTRSRWGGKIVWGFIFNFEIFSLCIKE